MKKNTLLRLTGELQACSPAEDSSDCVERHALVHPYILVAVQTAYNEVAPRQTPSAIQAQIYESPIQWPSVRAKTPSVPGKSFFQPRWSDRSWDENASRRSRSAEVRKIYCAVLFCFFPRWEHAQLKHARTAWRRALICVIHPQKSSVHFRTYLSVRLKMKRQQVFSGKISVWSRELQSQSSDSS